MYGPDSREVADFVSDVEQDLQAQYYPAACRSVTGLAIDAGTVSDVDYIRSVLAHPGYDGPVQCTVAGRLHRYSYHGSNTAQLSNLGSSDWLEYVSIDRYRHGHGGPAGFSNDLQPCFLPGFAAALEMAAPRAMGPELTLHDLHFKREESKSGYTSKYTYIGPGSSVVMFRVVRVYASKLRVLSYSIPSVPCNRCDIIYDSKRGYVRTYPEVSFVDQPDVCLPYPGPENREEARLIDSEPPY